MVQITRNLTPAAVFFCLMVSQAYVASAGPAPQVNLLRTFLDAGFSLEDAALKLLSGGKIQRASSYTSFWFYSRASGETSTSVRVGERNKLLKAGFSVSKPTKIIIHGWLQNGTDRFSVTTRNALLNNEDLNIIVVSWTKYSQQPYTVSRDAVPYVGAYLASFVDFLVQEVGVNMSSIHFIGFSLGAHVAGVAGENVTSGQLSRITGLDPAGPLYSNRTTKNRLDASDAEFVDVIHASAGTFGFADPCGTVDFYPNGGKAPQPGCIQNPELFCSHIRAYLFFAESVSSDGFVATRCGSYESYEQGECSGNETAIMGYNVSTGSEGVFYLDTNAESPYAKGN